MFGCEWSRIQEIWRSEQRSESKPSDPEARIVTALLLVTSFMRECSSRSAEVRRL